jgi:site-specific recombinase XerD
MFFQVIAMKGRKKIDHFMSIDELTEDAHVIIWLDDVASRSRSNTENTRNNYLIAIQHYVDFLRKTPTELLDIAVDDESKHKAKRETIRYLTNFKNHLKKTISPHTNKPYSEYSIKGYVDGVRSFYICNDIILPKERRSVAVKPTDESQIIPIIDEIKQCASDLKSGSLEKAFFLGQVSSGLSNIDMCNLTVKDFIDGYDELTGITVLDMRKKGRAKTGVEYITCFSKEATDAIYDYLDKRNEDIITESENSKLASLAKKVLSNDNYLFIKQKIPRSYTDKSSDDFQNEEIRKMTNDNVEYLYKRIAKSIDMPEMEKYTLTYIRGHSMRKFFSSYLKSNGVDWSFVDYLIGHKMKGSETEYTIMTPETIKVLYHDKCMPHLQFEYKTLLSHKELELEREIQKNTETLNEFNAVKERLEILERRDQFHNALDILRGRKYIDEKTGEITVFDDENDTMQLLKIYRDEGEEGIRKREVEKYGEKFVREVELEVEADDIISDIKEIEQNIAICKEKGIEPAPEAKAELLRLQNKLKELQNNINQLESKK